MINSYFIFILQKASLVVAFVSGAFVYGIQTLVLWQESLSILHGNCNQSLKYAY